MGLLKKKPQWSADDFRGYWLEHLVRSLVASGLRRYEQNHVVDQVQRGSATSAGPSSSTAFPCWFDEDAMRGVTTDAGRALVADENHFIGNLRIVAVDQVN
jgi:hypothetical protein